MSPLNSPRLTPTHNLDVFQKIKVVPLFPKCWWKTQENDYYDGFYLKGAKDDALTLETVEACPWKNRVENPV